MIYFLKIYYLCIYNSYILLTLGPYVVLLHQYLINRLYPRILCELAYIKALRGFSLHVAEHQKMKAIIGHLDGADVGVIIAYFVIIFAVGIWVCVLVIYIEYKSLVIPSKSWFRRRLLLGRSLHALDTCWGFPLC